ncbi:MAG: asparagine synthase (glutamine-hydrolyzing), partial [Elusimicrobiota bacterium]
MCGFVGIFDLSAKNRPDTGLVSRMGATIAHRGPDATGAYSDDAIALSFQRLAIIDLKNGSQPMSEGGCRGPASAEGGEDRYVIVFNGEIYNFQELRTGLQSQGHHFNTKSDTEVILRLFIEKGARCVEDLRGMFAFAIWDKRERRLFLARDRLGKKPLYWTLINGCFCFASEIKALAVHPDFRPDIDARALDLYLTYQSIPSPQTIYRNVQRLPPACHMRISADQRTPAPTRYWRLSYTQKFQGTPKDAHAQALHLIEEATRLRMISEVPLGAFLSGGIDSSAVVAMMARHSSAPVKTFAIGFDEQDFSELPHARQVASAFGCAHHELIVKPQMADILPKVLWHYDQPFADPSALPSYYVARETRKSVTVALNGDGGDEAFGGYLRYWGDYWAGLARRFIPGSLAMKAAAALESLPGTSTKSGRRIVRLLRAASRDMLATNYNLFSYFNAGQRAGLYTDHWKQALGPLEDMGYMRGLFESAAAHEDLDRIFSTDYHGYLPECLLVKMDVATMANSLEARSPLLDHKVVEFAASLPASWKVTPFGTKKFLREAFQ